MEHQKDDVNTQGGSDPQKTNPGDDINANLGKFNNFDNAPEMVTPDPTLAAQAIEEEAVEEKKERKFKIDFEKFNRRKQVASKNAFGIKLDIWLRNKKSFIIIWLVILGVVVTILVTQITIPIFVNKAIHDSTHPSSSKLYPTVGRASIILSYISLGLVPLPFLFLLTTWVVGVNAVAKSRAFHYVLWFMLLLSVLCMITSIGCGGFILNEYHSFNLPYSS